MGLKSDLKAAILANIADQFTKTSNPSQSQDDFAEKLADSIGDAVANAIDATTVNFILTAPPTGGFVTGAISLQNNVT